MVQEAVGNDAALQKELVVQVAIYGTPPEALWWAQFYNVDREFWPYTVKMLGEDDRYV